MKIAVTSQNFRTITGHAGKGRRFLVYEAADASGVVQEIDRLDLPKEYAFHDWHPVGEQVHPLDVAEVVITASCGQGFIQRLAERNIKVVLTSETDPMQAVQLFLRQELPILSPEEVKHHHAADHSHSDHEHAGSDDEGCQCH